MSEREPKPAVGMGATEHYPQDRYAHTIIEVCGPKRIVAQRDIAICTDPQAKSWGESVTRRQHYNFTRNPGGTKTELSLRHDGRWWPVGTRSGAGARWVIGRRDQYRDWGG